jgi:hypothetical protein
VCGTFVGPHVLPARASLLFARMLRRPRFRRTALWIAATPLLLASYVFGAPIVAGVVSTKFPAAEPVAKAMYAPLIFYAQRPELPGSQWFSAYAGSVEQRVAQMLK